ncbi:MAG: glutamate synthase large subunit [Candidatus Dadabacteria bacterium]|nr:MAG: glutamate synthase large subunit [Candidatus Dadabacteria bacterium]
MKRGRRAGLYDGTTEVDACGIGMIADLNNRRSHELVDQAIEILVNLTHRGAAGADGKTGDGAGILMQMPDTFLRKVTRSEGIELPDEGTYAAGVVFLRKDEGVQRDARAIIERISTERGHRFLGWRRVPVDSSALGEIARRKEPDIFQFFIEKASRLSDRKAFERDVYLTRKQIEREIRTSGLDIPEDVYFASFSANTLIYKGLLLAEQVKQYFPDLDDPAITTALALVHQRFSTNTFPEWDLAQPFRYMCHNGEINTLQGNVNWMAAREGLLAHPEFGDDVRWLHPVIRAGASDSACFDNALELLVQGGRSLPHAMLMMIPEAYEHDHRVDDARRGFFRYHESLMEPWDGPASMAFTDGIVAGATLDRNGLRPSRFVVTDEGLVVLASEVGVLDLPERSIVRKGRLQPGRIFLLDLEQGRIIEDEEVKRTVCTQKPYAQWVAEQKFTLADLPETEPVANGTELPLIQRQQAFGYTVEDKTFLLGPTAQQGKEPIGAMGTDTPLAVLSNRPKLLYDYFFQHFAQVSNPPIDPIREELVMSLKVLVGAEGNLLDETPEHAHQLELEQPILTDEALARIRNAPDDKLRSVTLPLLYPVDRGVDGFKSKLRQLLEDVADAVRNGATAVILSDRGVDQFHAALPALLAASAVHHHLIRAGLRKRCGIILESGEPREVHHFCLLAGYGVNAVNPYLAFETLREMCEDPEFEFDDYEAAVKNYIKGIGKGMLKTFSKMGVSTLMSYHGAQIFEAVGLDRDFVDEFFTNTPSRISGAGLESVAKESIDRHQAAFPERYVADVHLDWGGEYHWRMEGEEHHWSPVAIANLQKAVRFNDAEAYRAFAAEVNHDAERAMTIRGLLRFAPDREPVPIEEVEPAEAIMRRFKTGAMSLGSISAEAHETLAIAMNRIGGKSNTGEGGEADYRYVPLPNGDSRRSAIKQVASGRFGVTANYLANADEIQIKMAQGAKPGEGGQLPGHKVSVEIAAVRHSTPGVGLISPPPHHDIYSIEDLAQLIFDLKNANPKARINVKLVSKVGVGTIAAGVAKAYADVVLIAGNGGGTGASPLSSIKHAGTTWELGLAETHQVLVDNGLRSRIVVETDGGLRTGRDVVVATLLGAEEFGFATAALITMGCIMLRKCHLNTCSVGIATQRPELRERFAGDADAVVNYFRFVAEEIRELMAELGFRTIDEMVGQVQVLQPDDRLDTHWKARGLDLSRLLQPAPAEKPTDMYCNIAQQHPIDDILDRKLIEAAKPALEKRDPVRGEFAIRNRNRTCGTMLSYEVSRRYGADGLPPETIHFTFTGTAGQSFGAFMTKGIRFDLIGDANDYFGKGLSGATLSVRPFNDCRFVPEENMIIGNVSFYGATDGKAFIRGRAGERFCVRNSGVTAVVEGVGDHGCEYMTGGHAVILGDVGRNFAAGMSGGIAYVLMDRDEFERMLNPEMVELERLEDEKEIEAVRGWIQEHVERTGSTVGERALNDWDNTVERLIKVMPVDYRIALEQGLAHREY